MHNQKRIAVPQWWLKGPVDPRDVLGAYQAIGALSLAHSYQNLNGRGSNDLVVGTAPGFASATGWEGDGSTTYLTVGASGAIKSGVPLSMICLFNLDDATGTHSLMSIARSSGASHNFTLRAAGATSGDPVTAISSAASAKTATTTTGFKAGKWCVGGAVFASATLRTAYILSEDSRNTAFKQINWGDNGTETSSSTPASLDYTYIGCTHDSSSTTNFVDGKIGACAFYNIALNDLQFLQIALALLKLVV